MKFTRDLIIRFEHCDAAGIIFYPRYFEIVDASTVALFERALGMTKIRFLKHYNFGGMPVVATQARFIRPTRYGDDVAVDSTIAFGNSSFTVEHTFSLGGETACVCTEKRVWVVSDPANPTMLRSQPIPAAVRGKFGV